jgi:hypothetical protein
VPTGALVIGVSWGALANDPAASNDEMLQLLDNAAVQRDLVDYDDTAPWPTDNNSASIYLKGLSLDNNNGANWARSVVNQGSAISPSGAPFSTSDVGSPGRFFLPGDYNTNGIVDAADYALWRQLLGTSDPRADGSGPTTGVPDGVVDQFDHTFWKMNFGNVGVPPAGSGAGTGEAVAASLSSEPLAIQLTPVEPAAARNTSAIDAALVNLVSSSVGSSPRTPTNADSLSGKRQATVGANLLLILSKATVTPQTEELYLFQFRARETSKTAAVDACLDIVEIETLFNGVGARAAL